MIFLLWFCIIFLGIVCVFCGKMLLVLVKMWMMCICWYFGSGMNCSKVDVYSYWCVGNIRVCVRVM